ncbi:S-adenosyl-L-methionine-dependent uroporphyrinogen III methyltransferase, chloroplastic isoform X2 [Spinacia oleracea]|uniref:uroporphyrinogen-III C-methyltransferase n=1 Tax=Spinacia oleracea TaxID=3562 RepID=A0A9R0IQ26_SPIOL|nr:S-adenosyl-L-methionine-dependent uroporphyrinogen III methyltransferase, chloroplastic isoform X2 [Spinacia oleracea]
MASLNHLHSLSIQTSTAFHTNLQKPKTFHTQICVNYRQIVCCSTSSPFTEKNSVERYQREHWVYPVISQFQSSQSQEHCQSSSPPQPSKDRREDDIASQLPELKKLLEVLREKRESQSQGGGNSGVIGNVYLVGTGPGDPELLTVKALKIIQSADLLLYDRLVSNDVLEMVGPNAKLLYVGKTAGYHSRTQEEIHQLLLSFAEAGANVVRLKGGDPLIFGRGGEEMDFLQQKGIQVKVVPGISAELGIPLTHRGIATSVRYLTGHSRNGGTDPLYVAENAADPDCTLVVYMGLATLPALAQKLVQHGLPNDTPAVAVERGTTAQQRLKGAKAKRLQTEQHSADLPTFSSWFQLYAGINCTKQRKQNAPLIVIELTLSKLLMVLKDSTITLTSK